MLKNWRILTATLVPISASAIITVTSVSVIHGPKLKTLLLIQKLSKFQKQYKTIYDKRDKEVSALKTKYQDIDAQVKKLVTRKDEINEQLKTSPNDAALQAELEAVNKEIEKTQKEYNKFKKEHDDLFLKNVSLGLNLKRIFTPLGTTYDNIEKMRKENKMTKSLWNAAYKEVEIVRNNYEAWLLKEYKDI
ncbi:hypothetical protein PUW95_02685 [Metamycoplasma hyosynoviae]|uniref:Uncharacterized protein n=1 Tax=Metamycoplasma hyosynoviae TaxID=29559 RepID=A0A4P1QG72_9BACT|nr:hypothetical protein [Metamycoplasma hyosynoviae]ASI54040.1 hypothetical protein MHSN_02530 [Metamycoplasma hyosynoviae]MDC8916113.1 hypothetical protein [Metamycoplasma hyosynoviae]MDD7897621.1 hypothetical protein [Metamycoplasma hyosynoviae]